MPVLRRRHRQGEIHAPGDPRESAHPPGRDTVGQGMKYDTKMSYHNYYYDMMLCIFRDLKGNNERKALTHLNETLKVYNKVLHRFHEELMKVRIHI